MGGWQGGRRKPFRKRKDRVTILVSVIVSQVYAIVKTEQMVHLNMKLVVCQSHLRKAVKKKETSNSCHLTANQRQCVYKDPQPLASPVPLLALRRSPDSGHGSLFSVALAHSLLWRLGALAGAAPERCFPAVLRFSPSYPVGLEHDVLLPDLACHLVILCIFFLCFTSLTDLHLCLLSVRLLEFWGRVCLLPALSQGEWAPCQVEHSSSQGQSHSGLALPQSL